jgi:hypothetical protein
MAPPFCTQGGEEVVTHLLVKPSTVVAALGDALFHGFQRPPGGFEYFVLSPCARCAVVAAVLVNQGE